MILQTALDAICIEPIVRWSLIIAAGCPGLAREDRALHGYGGRSQGQEVKWEALNGACDTTFTYQMRFNDYHSARVMRPVEQHWECLHILPLVGG